MASTPGHEIPVIRGGQSRTARIAPAAVLAAGIALTGVATVATSRAATQDRHLRFARVAEDARTALERRIGAYAEILHGLRSFAGTKPDFDRRAFRRHVALTGALDRFPGLQALSFNRLVRAQDIDSYHARVRADPSTPRIPTFVVHPRGTSGSLFVIEFIEPTAGNESALGFDVASEPARRVAVEEARSTGEVTATAPVTLVQDPSSQRGFLLFLAIYQTGDVPVTAPARRRHAVGVMAIVQRVDELVAGVVGDGTQVRIEEIFDVGPTVASTPLPLSADRALIGASTRGSALSPRTIAEPHQILDLNVGSRRWRVLMTARSNAFDDAARSLPWAVAGGGSLLSVLLAALIASFGRSRSRAIALAERMTEGLRARESDLERANTQLEQANVRLEASNATMREFVAVASHDMRSPLAVVIGFARLLHEGWEDVDPEVRRERLEIIQRRAEQLNRLVNDLLTTSEIEGKTITPRAEHLDLCEEIRRVLEELAVPPERFETACDDPLAATADRSHVNRMITNLVENGLKYGEPPLRIEGRRDGDSTIVSVADRGPGVPEELLPRLFQKFSRAAPVGEKADIEGTGLGLSIVRGLATANGGDVWYEPNDPSGARFCFRLPAAQ